MKPPFLYGYSEKPPNLVVFYDTLGMRMAHSRLHPPGPQIFRTDLFFSFAGELQRQQILLYLIFIINITNKENDLSKDATWEGDKPSCLPPHVMSPYHILRQNTLRLKYITSCLSFRYNN